ncbi:MAG: flagellar biosynthetic protein FliO [Candidatus Marinimicrobia bacterium]|nr:flagellar biosynthetic protein FliO [Candidatus Neomarinimicrobiota bacterium]MCF7841148.1 flagellar biosynthetic protein FliO [Candidatus Neomarinimicrobiota bacterium]MCF7901951.1 flagellar biosynthetic protein FliO [Candidatus Neomarinimicrobiota bacterium]
MKNPSTLISESNETLPGGKKPSRFNLISIFFALVAVYGVVMLLPDTKVSPSPAKAASSATDSVTIFTNQLVSLEKHSGQSASTPARDSGVSQYSQYIMRVLAFIILLVAAFWWVTKWLKTRKGTTGQAALPMEVIGRRFLGPKQSVAAVKVGEKIMLLGVTEQNIGLLTTLSEKELDLASGGLDSAAETAPQFADIVQQLTQKYRG